MGLFEPIWKTDDEEELRKALAAVHDIDDPKKLRNVVLNAHLPEVQFAALVKIDDPQVLREVILADNTAYDLRRNAVRRISDPEILTGIAMERRTYPADGDAVAMISDPELLKKIALSEQGGEQDKAVYKITDQRDLAEIAVSAKKGSARKTAIRNINDPDVLMDIINNSEEAYTRTEAHLRINTLNSDPGDPKLSPEQKERYLQTVISEPDRNVKIDLSCFREPEDLERIYRNAVRYDLKSAALSRLVLHEAYPAERLLKDWKAAEQNRKTIHNTFSNLWQDAQNKVENRLEIEKIRRPSLLLDFIKDPEIGSAFSAKCLKALFDGSLDSHDGIDTLRDEAFAAYLRNIPAYITQDESTDSGQYLLQLSKMIPDSLHDRYGLAIYADEYGENG